jgi:hypothetical protein
MRRLALTLAALALAACGKDSKDSTGPEGASSVAGVYTLRTINGESLPFVASDGVATYTIRSGRLSLNPDGTCSHQLSFSVTSNQGTFEDATPFACTYEVNGATVVTTDLDDGTRAAATYRDGTLTATDGDFTAVYRR